MCDKIVTVVEFLDCSKSAYSYPKDNDITPYSHQTR